MNGTIVASPASPGGVRGGQGGSGLVIIRFPSNFAAADTTGSYSEINGYRVYTFTGSGTLTF